MNKLLCAENVKQHVSVHAAGVSVIKIHLDPYVQTIRLDVDDEIRFKERIVV